MNKNLSTLFSYLDDLDTRSAQFLMKAMESNNMPGFDYIEYKQSLRALLSMNMDESTAFKSAFATASTMGLTKQKLLETATHYKQILQKEKGQFDVALKNRFQQRVGAKIEENKQHEGRLKQIEDQIKRLEKEILEVKKQITSNDKVREKENTKLTVQQDNFEQTYVRIQGEIDKDTSKINQFI
jgi:predicted  nucleic acid-binding Zn-ribbon protein